MLCTYVLLVLFFNRRTHTQEVARLFTLLFCAVLEEESDEDLPTLPPQGFPPELHGAIAAAEEKIRKAMVQL